MSNFWFFFHNFVIHPLLALGQWDWAARLHDITAEKMND